MTDGAGADPAVELLDLVKRYPGRPVDAVAGVSFSVGRGEVFGLLGPNGAGKTSTVGVLTTRVRPSGGSARVAGIDVVADPVGAKARLAVVSQRPNLDRQLSARQNLVWHAAYHGVPKAERAARADALLAELGLADRGEDKVDRWSGGQAQRLLIARALMHDPQVLFLDEPTTGLDPQARLFVWDRVRELRQRGTTVVLTTHDMDEATELCDRVGIMDRGRLLTLGSPAALTAAHGGSGAVEVGLEGAAPADLAVALARVAGSAGAEPVDGGLRVRADGPAAPLLVPVAQVLAAYRLTPTSLRVTEPTLEDVFIGLTGRGLR